MKRPMALPPLSWLGCGSFCCDHDYGLSHMARYSNIFWSFLPAFVRIESNDTSCQQKVDHTILHIDMALRGGEGVSKQGFSFYLHDLSISQHLKSRYISLIHISSASCFSSFNPHTLKLPRDPAQYRVDQSVCKYIPLSWSLETTTSCPISYGWPLASQPFCRRSLLSLVECNDGCLPTIDPPLHWVGVCTKGTGRQNQVDIFLAQGRSSDRWNETHLGLFSQHLLVHGVHASLPLSLWYCYKKPRSQRRQGSIQPICARCTSQRRNEYILSQRQFINALTQTSITR